MTFRGDADPSIAALVASAEILWSISSTQIEPADAPAVFAQVIAVRASRHLRAISVLVDAGYVSESAALVRSLWEDAITAAFIREKPEERALKWIDFAERRAAHHARSDASNPGLQTELTAEVRTRLDAIEAATGADWAGTSAISLARGLKASTFPESAQLGCDFDVYYGFLCDDAHGSPYAVSHLLSVGGLAEGVTVGPDTRRSEELPALAIYGAWQLGVSINALGIRTDVASLRRFVDEAHARVKASG